MSTTARRRAELTALVVEIFTDSDETYGYRRVHAELGRRSVPAGLELIRAIMRDQGLVPCQPQPWRARPFQDRLVVMCLPCGGGR